MRIQTQREWTMPGQAVPGQAVPGQAAIAPVEHLLALIEPKMRSLLPADLYTAVWLDPSPAHLMRVFQHLRTLQHTLHDYVPRRVAIAPPQPGIARYSRHSGTLLFTDLAGFTPLLEANAANGQAGALALMAVLNQYFSEMLEIISKSGGDLLEFTGDAMLVQFSADTEGSDTAQAVRAGLRMQRAMSHFQNIETPQGIYSLQMRIGIHAGEFLTADLGTPLRMVHVLVGETVQRAKRAEGAGRVGRVCVTREMGGGGEGRWGRGGDQERVGDGKRGDGKRGDGKRGDEGTDRLVQFQLEPLDEEHWLVCDDWASDRLGEYDLTPSRRRLSTPLLVDRSVPALVEEIGQALNRVEPLAGYLPAPVRTLLVENTARRQIEPEVTEPVVVFVNLTGLPEAIAQSTETEVGELIAQYSRIFSQIQAIVQARGGILQKVTYHSVGADVLLYFGALGRRVDDPQRAAATALAVRELVEQSPPLVSNGMETRITCRIGIDQGAVFAAEIGEQRGRREFNILGDPVNTAARLMAIAPPNQILLTEPVYRAVTPQLVGEPLGELLLKGKVRSIQTFTLNPQCQ